MEANKRALIELRKKTNFQGFNNAFKGPGDPTAIPNNNLSITDGYILIGNASNLAEEHQISGDATLSNSGVLTLNTVGISKGGTGKTSWTTGSIIFAGSTTLDEDNSYLYYDKTNHAVGLGTNSLYSNTMISGKAKDTTSTNYYLKYRNNGNTQDYFTISNRGSVYIYADSGTGSNLVLDVRSSTVGPSVSILKVREDGDSTFSGHLKITASTVNSEVLEVENTGTGYSGYFSSYGNFTVGSVNSAVFHYAYNGSVGNNIQNMLLLRNNTSASASSGLGCAIGFLIKNSATPNFYSGYISQCLTTVTAGSEDSRIDFVNRVAGALTNVMSILKDRVGIGTLTPSVELEVNGYIKTSDPSGGTAKKVKFGEIINVANAGLTALGIDKQQRIDVDGTVYYAMLSTTQQ